MKKGLVIVLLSVIGFVGLVRWGLARHAANYAKWEQSLTSSQKAHITTTLQRFTSLQGRDLLEFRDRHIELVYRTNYDNFESIRSPVSGDRSGGTTSNSRLAYNVERIISPTDPEYSALAARFLQQK